MFDIESFVCNDAGILCGGNGIRTQNELERFFIRLTENEVKLVFIQDLAIEINREDLWMNRRDKNFENFVALHELIESRMPSVLIANSSRFGSNTIPFASRYGEYRFARPGRDCDFEIASYAMKHNVMAVLTADTDFLIFDGHFKVWMILEIDFKNFTVTEYDRLLINRKLYLTFEQRPVLATLAGNDFTNVFRSDLDEFHRHIGGSKPWERFPAIARYIRRYFVNNPLTGDDIDRIVRMIFGTDADNDKRRHIVDSLESYNLERDDGDSPIEDLIRAHFEKTNNIECVRLYLKLNINNAQTLTMPFNDMICAEFAEILVQFLVELLRKKMGILNPDRQKLQFKLLAKKSRDEPFDAYTEDVIYPECEHNHLWEKNGKNFEELTFKMCSRSDAKSIRPFDQRRK